MNTQNSAKLFVTIGTVAILLILMGALWMSYNKLVIKEEKVFEAWSQVESNLQRKVDLLPNLVKVVKSYAAHEKELLTEVTRLRASSISALQEIQKQNNAPGEQEVQAARQLNKRIDASILKLFAVAENYPAMRSSEHFLRLQAQIEGAENRINITRMQFNSSVSEFNAYSKTIPANIMAAMGGFQRKAYFKAEAIANEKLELDL